MDIGSSTATGERASAGSAFVRDSRCLRRQPKSRFALLPLSIAMAATDTPGSKWLQAACNQLALELRAVLSALTRRPYDLLVHHVRYRLDAHHRS